MKVSRSRLIKKADLLFSELVRKKGECEVCGKRESLQCSHVIPRTNKNLRWNLDNGVCLCYRHHIHWWHKNPMEAMEWFKTNKPIQYAFLMREKNKINPDVGGTIEGTIKELTEKIKTYDI